MAHCGVHSLADAGPARKDPNDPAELLQRMPLFEGVETAVVQRLGKAATIGRYERGEHLWHAGQAPIALSIVRSGLVKVVRPTPNGRTALCGLFGRSSPLGEVALIKDIPYPSSTLAATKGVSVVNIPRAELLHALSVAPRLSINLLCSLEGRLTMLHDKIDVLSAGSVEARLATLLIKLYQQFGDEIEGGIPRIMVPLSRQELADLVSMTFETAIRVLTRWERAGVVSTDGDGFTLHDVTSLTAISGVSSSDWAVSTWVG
ncbi:MAG TPA: Crp/Fnr family transcriptional regulator [Polyangiaceae bacterium]|nr:Crp/Fnr family transcriptional regulator [Polyangiaceae bacterium]